LIFRFNCRHDCRERRRSRRRSALSRSLNEAGHPRNLAHTDSKAVTPISPAAQKLHLLIRCSLFDSSVTLAVSSMPGLILGKCHIADANQHIAEALPVIIAAVSMSDLIIRLSSFRERMAIMLLSGRSHCVERFGLAVSTQPPTAEVDLFIQSATTCPA
jgi:hypothetical protein